MLIEKISLNDGYEIRVECENGLYRTQGFLNGKSVTHVYTKDILGESGKRLDKSAKDYEQSTAKAIEECGIEECLTLEEALPAIISKMPKKEPIYQDMVSVVEALLKDKQGVVTN